MPRPHGPYPGAEAWVPERASLPQLRAAVASCQGCPLYRYATQAVFGEGPARARVVMIGEVPGDQEDKAGHVFVGPAGRLLDDVLAAAGIARDEVYLTNAVKHFKFTRRGKRRIHDKPTRYEQRACKPWLDAELARIHPEVVVAMGAVAAQALFGSHFKVTEQRGVPFETEYAAYTFATVHPSSVLRAPDAEARAAARRALIADLERVAAHLRRGKRLPVAGTKAAHRH
jgi:uracil-DNA glycosylase family protein